jgi:hypothetical protein
MPNYKDTSFLRSGRLKLTLEKWKIEKNLVAFLKVLKECN